ncbi:MAG: hypothetical protein QM597_00400, partial [Aeromicrobium sp.]|uniref:hypothetical protein n=1 Tax=Aeromicrobium sp. TaxID=1871063 RepID=UPI0039E2FBE7
MNPREQHPDRDSFGPDGFIASTFRPRHGGAPQGVRGGPHPRPPRPDFGGFGEFGGVRPSRGRPRRG